MKNILALLLTFLISYQVFGETPADSVKVYFRVGYSQYNPAFGNNREAMDSFIVKVRQANAADSIERMVVRGFASPDGTNKANERLARRRCSNIADYISEKAGIDHNRIETQPGGIAWDELRTMVAENPRVPSQDKVLDILDNTPVWIFDTQGRVIGGRKMQLMALDAGRPYRWMLEHIFPKLRNSVAVTLYLKSPNIVPVTDNTALTNKSEDALKATTTDALLQKAELEAATESYYAHRDTVVAQSSANYTNFPVEIKKPKSPQYFALKTNMLYDAALIPNLGAEFYLGKNISIYGDWMYAWWKNDNKHRYWNIYGGNLGLRWWLGKKAHEKPLTGHHVGIYGGAFIFDFEFGNRGYMGGKPGGTLLDQCFINAGVEYGYSLPVAKHFNIDFSVGFGYISGKYMEYIPDGFEHGYLWQSTKRFGWIGPTKLEISLVWLIGRGNVNKKGGNR